MGGSFPHSSREGCESLLRRAARVLGWAGVGLQVLVPWGVWWASLPPAPTSTSGTTDGHPFRPLHQQAPAGRSSWEQPRSSWFWASRWTSAA